jgi:hypothetical protein
MARDWRDVSIGVGNSIADVPLPLSLHGGNDERVDRDDLTTMLKDFLALSSLRKTRRSGAANFQDLPFRDNRSFWTTARRLHEGATVVLENFAVLEWAPAAPGRYYTQEAAEARRTALQFINPDKPEYLPLGKMNMVLGGVGSVRLASIPAPGERTHFLGASSTGVSHEGIPLCVGRDLYLEMIPFLKENGACDCTIVGTIELVPETVEGLDYGVGIPRFVVDVRDVTILRPARAEKTRVSLSVLYIGAVREYETSRKESRDVGWTFASFDPCGRDSDQELKDTVDWLRGYAAQHSAFSNPPILCDFDQQVRHFGDDVVFSLDDVIRGGVDLELLGRLVKHHRLTINVQQVGDRFENVVNSQIINRSELL